ncbi:hypothetical protein [Lentibacillus juripiscarius]|uniref:DUF2479 domain-containing protein n=1 Tax=Lentibacillus juripiscarius TaxID=257446 RepID=A0ABW5V8K7_9BACI
MAIDLRPGALKKTGRALDVALTGKNYLFQIQVTAGNGTETRYTRDGSFYLSSMNNNEDVMPTTKDGHPVLGKNGPMVFADGFDSISNQPNGHDFYAVVL